MPKNIPKLPQVGALDAWIATLLNTAPLQIKFESEIPPEKYYSHPNIPGKITVTPEVIYTGKRGVKTPGNLEFPDSGSSSMIFRAFRNSFIIGLKAQIPQKIQKSERVQYEEFHKQGIKARAVWGPTPGYMMCTWEESSNRNGNIELADDEYVITFPFAGHPTLGGVRVLTSEGPWPSEGFDYCIVDRRQVVKQEGDSGLVRLFGFKKGRRQNQALVELYSDAERGIDTYSVPLGRIVLV
jgi:hypothetical protein